MQSSALEKQIESLLKPIVEDMGYEFWGCEYVPTGRHATLRIYIDKPAGVTVDDCADVSHEVSGVLDVEDPVPGAYNLEISSPGLDRPLMSPAHFERYAGEEIQLRSAVPVMGRKRFKGALTAVNDEGVEVEVDGERYFIPFEEIEKANLVPKF